MAGKNGHVGGMYISIAQGIITRKRYIDRMGDKLIERPFWEFTVMDGEGSTFTFTTDVDLTDIPFEPLGIEAHAVGSVKDYAMRLRLDSLSFKRLVPAAVAQ